jgi:3'-5' exoribonuclease
MGAMSPLDHRPIATWVAGDAVHGFALLRRREERRDKTGKLYLDLELADASGSIPAKAWSDSGAHGQKFGAGEFVRFKGQVQSFRDQLQLKVDQCRRVLESDREEGFDEALLIPSTREDPEELWRRLEELLEAHLVRPEAKRLAAGTLAVHGADLRVHPAAKAIHHAFRGGLLEHVTSMLGLAVKICEHYPELDRDLMLLGVLFHDLGKLLELGRMPGSEYTPAGRLVGHIVLGRDLLRERAAEVPEFPPELLLQLEHLVLSHQGRQDFGSPVVPSSSEAIALHMIDDLDSKLALMRQLRESQSGFQFVRSLERYVWLGEDGVPEGDLAAEEAAPAAEDTSAAEASQKRIW